MSQVFTPCPITCVAIRDSYLLTTPLQKITWEEMQCPAHLIQWPEIGPIVRTRLWALKKKAFPVGTKCAHTHTQTDTRSCLLNRAVLLIAVRLVQIDGGSLCRSLASLLVP